MTIVRLPALRADSVLGFMAALGAARILNDDVGVSGVRLGWPDGPYAAAAIDGDFGSIDDLADAIWGVIDAMKARQQLLPGVGDFPPATDGSTDPTSTLTLSDARQLAGRARADAALGKWLQAVVAVVPPIDRRTGEASTLEKNRFLRAGPGTVWVPRTLAKTLAILERASIESALRSWRRVDGHIGAYLDGRADVDKATSSSKKALPKRGVPGATFMALMALPWFTVRSPTPFLAETVGWSQAQGVKHFQWPVWTSLLDSAAIEGLVDHPAVHGLTGNASSQRRALGIDTVFRSRRISAGNNDAAMAPAQVVWDRPG